MQKPLTQKRIENIALFYLDRFDASRGKLRQVLSRRVLHQKMLQLPIDPQVPKWIENTIQKMCNLGYIDDKRYAENIIRRLSASGKSTRFILQKLQTEGIDSELINSLLDPADDLERAKIFVHKKRLGSNYEKDLTKLARAGFNYETAKQALKGETDV